MPKTFEETLELIEKTRDRLMRLSVRHFDLCPIVTFQAALRMTKGGTPTPKELDDIVNYLKSQGLDND